MSQTLSLLNVIIRMRDWETCLQWSSLPLSLLLTLPKGLMHTSFLIQEESNRLISSMRTTFKSRHDRSDVLLTLSTKYLLVGTCEQRFSGTARFYQHEVVYSFDHPVHRQVEMHMKYIDMDSIRVQNNSSTVSTVGRNPELCFKIRNQLSYFVREYDPSDTSHELILGFRSASDLQELETRVLPHICVASTSGSATKLVKR